jgi:transcriptional regulator with XRE-family HTH domain
LALAHEAGVNTRTIERIEAGERMADDTLKKVAKALQLAEGAFTEPHLGPSGEELAAMAISTADVVVCSKHTGFAISCTESAKDPI